MTFPIEINDDFIDVLWDYIEKVRSDGTKQNNYHAVYVLECTVPKNGDSVDYEDRVLYEYALEADRVYYVGYTSWLMRRMREHVNGSNFTKSFPPKTLVQIEWYDSIPEAREREDNLVKNLDTRTDSLRPGHTYLRDWDDSYEEKIFAHGG